MKEKFAEIIRKELPNFWYGIYEFTFLSEPVISIRIAANNYLINGVPDQRPQSAGLTYSRGQLSGHASIYREINPDNPSERYCVMTGIYPKVRKHRPGKELEALTKFCRNYKQALKDNLPKLMYKEYVDYERLLA